LQLSLVNQSVAYFKSKSYYKWIVLISVMFGTFMAVLDGTIVNVALPEIMGNLGLTISSAEWVLNGYLLAFGIVLPTTGWIADTFGFKKTLLLGMFLFTIFSFACSLSWNETSLITFRVFQGIGSGLILPIGLAIITREFPPEQRGLALGFWTVASSASVSLGPTIGGYLVDRFSWHAIFDVNVPVGIVGFIFILFIQEEIRSETKQKLDLLGLIFLVFFIGPLLMALSTANSSWNTNGWTSNWILANLAISIVSAFLFFYVEIKRSNPLIDLRLFIDKNFSITNLTLFIFGFGMFGSVFLIPIYLENSLDYTPLQVGFLYLPVGAVQIIIAPIAGWISDKFSAKIPAMLGMALLGVSILSYYNLSLQSSYSDLEIPLLIRGVGIGMIFGPLSLLALVNIKPDKMAQASGLLNVIRQIGGSFGIAFFGTILTQRTIFHTAIYGQSVDTASPQFQKTVLQLVGHSMRTAGSNIGTATQQAETLIASNVSSQAFVQAADDVFLIAAVIVLFAVIPILFTKNPVKRNKKHA
jgi:DHA2 family multidrug resistance protein